MFFRKKQPEKPKPNFLGEQYEHKSCVIVFDGTRAMNQIESLKNTYNKCTVIKNKPVERLNAMIDSCNEISTQYYRLHASCIQTLNVASNASEAAAIQLGLIPNNPIQGIAFCPGCLQQTIFACEEVLQALKDIQEATKEYV